MLNQWIGKTNRKTHACMHAKDQRKDVAVPLELLSSVGMLAKRYMVNEILSMVTQALKGRLRLAKTQDAVEDFHNPQDVDLTLVIINLNNVREVWQG